MWFYFYIFNSEQWIHQMYGYKYFVARRKNKNHKMINFGTYKEYELARMEGVS